MAQDHFGDHVKHVLVLAVVAALCALAVYLTAQGYRLGALPGDIAIAVAEYNFYFPATTTAIVSGALNLFVFLCYSAAAIACISRTSTRRRTLREGSSTRNEEGAPDGASSFIRRRRR